MEPYILDETDDFAVVFKPPRMHCAPLRQGGDTLLDWYAAIFPPVMELSGRKEGEGGLLHRLDFETHGLVLFAKSQRFLENIIHQQDEGDFVKEYTAVCHKPTNKLAPAPLVIESFFRPFGPGRKQVRPVMEPGRKETASDKGGFYRTEITGFSETGDHLHVAIELRRGFRHQIRCHLAWIGCPILNDALYGHQAADGFLALQAAGLVFYDCGGKQKEYRI